jgi:hypothetical protein
MIFEKVMAEHLNDLRQKIHGLGNEFPEMAPHFGLSHAGLVDTETEKLVEMFCFHLTESEASRKSVIANKIKPFMEVIFPEWYRPEVSSCLAEFNNYEEFQSFTNLMQQEEPITFECEYEEKTVSLSANPGFPLLPFSIEKSYFTVSETLTHLHFYFKNHFPNEADKKNNKIRIYLNSSSHEEILSLIHYIFEPSFNEQSFFLKLQDKEISLDREFISFPLFELHNAKQNVFFDCKNIFKDVLNRLHHYFYIEIDLGKSDIFSSKEFSIHIPLNKNAYSEFSNLQNFAKTNCMPLYDVYKKGLKTITIDKDSNEENILICDLKNNHTLEVTDVTFYDFNTKRNQALPEYMDLESTIRFTPFIPYNINHHIIFKETDTKSNSFVSANGIFTHLLTLKDNMINRKLKNSGSLNSDFGFVLTQPTQTLFYSEILSDSDFFHFIYNWNYFVGKKMNNLSMVLEYIEKMSHLSFNFKESFYKYFNEIEIIKWKMVARMSKKGDPLIISRYQLKQTENKCNYVFDRILEKILDSLAETDLVYEFVRI